jgi:hypothetical protein
METKHKEKSLSKKITTRVGSSVVGLLLVGVLIPDFWYIGVVVGVIGTIVLFSAGIVGFVDKDKELSPLLPFSLSPFFLYCFLFRKFCHMDY